MVVSEGAVIGWGSIVVAVDGSKNSRTAVETAADFAVSYGGALSIISVAPVTAELYAEAPGIAEQLIWKSQKFAEDAKALAQSKGIEAVVLVRDGEPYEIITRLASEQKSDVIVIGCHGKTGLKRLLMGSVTAKVIGCAPCPVLVVR